LPAEHQPLRAGF